MKHIIPHKKVTEKLMFLFLNEIKLLINHLIQLLITVINKIILESEHSSFQHKVPLNYSIECKRFEINRSRIITNFNSK